MVFWDKQGQMPWLSRTTSHLLSQSHAARQPTWAVNGTTTPRIIGYSSTMILSHHVSRNKEMHQRSARSVATGQKGQGVPCMTLFQHTRQKQDLR